MADSGAGEGQLPGNENTSFWYAPRISITRMDAMGLAASS
jgi:hypothetical protein